MARKDEILQSFLEHEIIINKYNVDSSSLPRTVRDGLKSDVPIIKAISLIVENMEPPTQVTDTTLRNIITQYLSEAAI